MSFHGKELIISQPFQVTTGEIWAPRDASNLRGAPPPQNPSGIPELPVAWGGSSRAPQLGLISFLHGLVGQKSGCHSNFQHHFRLDRTFPKAPLHLCVLGNFPALVK